MNGAFSGGLAMAAIVALCSHPAGARPPRGQLAIGARVVAPCTIDSGTGARRGKAEVHISCPVARRSSDASSDQATDSSPARYELSRKASDMERSMVIEISF